MARLIRLSIALAFNIAAGLGTFLALANGGFAQELPPVTVAFGAWTGNSDSVIGAAIYSATVAVDPVTHVVTLSAAPLAPVGDGWPTYTPQPPVSALAFRNNTATSSTDLIASNLATGDLYTLPAPYYSSATDLFPSGECGPFPAGLGADGAGNILGAGNMGCSPSPSVFIYEQSDGTIPVLMDSVNHDAGLAGGGAISTIADAAVAPISFANGIQAGDLIVLVGDTYSNSTQPVVFVYPHSVIAQGLTSGFPVAGLAGAKALVTQGNFPSGSNPVSMAISPIDGSLLIAVSDGTIWMLPPTPSGYGTPQKYASINSTYCFSSCDGHTWGWGKIGAMQQGGSLYVFAAVEDTTSTNPHIGILALFSGTVPTGGFTAPSTSWSGSDVQPTSVAVLQQTYKTGTILASECFDPNTCDIIGDGAFTLSIVQHVQSIPAGATITQQECVVPVDPRGPNCSGGARPLPFKEVCPGLNDTRIIPTYACGSPGFILFASLAEQVDDTTGIEVVTHETLKTELPPDPGCPVINALPPYSTGNNLLYGYNQYSSVETQLVEGNTLLEATNSCIPDPSGSSRPHASVDGEGFALNLTQFAVGRKSGPVGFVDFKFNNLQQTIKNSNIKYPWERVVLVLGVAVAKQLVDVGHYDCAAELMYLLDRFVRRHVGDFLHSAPGAAVREPNPAFDIIMRLSNAYYRIETGIENKPPNPSWPLAADPHLCHTHECDLPGVDK